MSGGLPGRFLGRGELAGHDDLVVVSSLPASADVLASRGPG